MEKQKCPELRFKGFDLKWEKNVLGDITSFINGRAYSQEELLKKGKYPVLRVGNFNTNSHWYYSDLELGDKYYAEDGDLLYTWSTIFSPYIWKGEKVIYHYHIWKVELSKKLDKLFTFHYLKADENTLTSNTNGSTMMHVTKGEMESKTIHIPSLDEQNKIGIFFENLNSKITLLEKKLTQTQNLKKAMLEKMFPKAGSTQPEIRLKGFSGDWEEFQLENLGEFKNGMNMDKDSMGFGNPFVNIQHVFESTEVTKHNLELVNATNKQKKDYNLLEGDVLFVRSSVKLEGVGDTAVLVDDIEGATYSGFLIRFRSNINLSLDYKKVMFSIPLVRKQILANATTSANTNINQESLKKILILLPKYEEQTQIGLFFKQLDETLLLQQQQLQTLKNLKQAFLEKMFI